MIQAEHLTRLYGQKGNLTRALDDVSFKIAPEEICVIAGASGSGKSTLLNVVGGLDHLDAGELTVAGEAIATYSEKQLQVFRRNQAGFVFQFYNLVPDITVLENVQTGAFLSSSPLEIDPLLERLGLGMHKMKFPSQLSGGQQQRVSIARALVKNPKLLLCDEPTGALDSISAKEILMVLQELNQQYGTTIVMVTHNQEIEKMAHHVIRMKDGTIIKETWNSNPLPAGSLEL